MVKKIWLQDGLEYAQPRMRSAERTRNNVRRTAVRKQRNPAAAGVFIPDEFHYSAGRLRLAVVGVAIGVEIRWVELLGQGFEVLGVAITIEATGGIHADLAFAANES